MWTQRLLEAAGVAALTFFTGMAVYKGYSDIAKIGVYDAVYQPAIQAFINFFGALGIRAGMSTYAQSRQGGSGTGT